MDYTSIFNLELKGEFIAVYSDKASYQLIFLNEEDNQAYVIISNKYFEVENLYDIYNGKELFDSEDIVFTKPFNDNFNEFIFKGFIKKNGNYHKFTIENYKFTIEEERVDYNDATKEVESLKEFIINYFIQKKNYLYFVGFDSKVNEDVFVIYDLIKNNIKYLNNFYSDQDYIILNHLCFDEDKIIICGYIENESKEKIPFLTYLHNPVR